MTAQPDTPTAGRATEDAALDRVAALFTRARARRLQQTRTGGIVRCDAVDAGSFDGAA